MSSCCSAVSPPGCSRASRRCPRSARRCRSASADMITAAPPPPSPPDRGHQWHSPPGCLEPPLLCGPLFPRGPLSPLSPQPLLHLCAPVLCSPLTPGLPHPLCPHVFPYHPTQADPLCPLSPRIPFPPCPPSPLCSMFPLFPMGLPCVTPSPLPLCPPCCPHATALTVLPHAHVEALLEAAGLALPPLGLGDRAAPGEGAGEVDALVDGAPGGTWAVGTVTVCPQRGRRGSRGWGTGYPGVGATSSPQGPHHHCAPEKPGGPSVGWQWPCHLVPPCPVLSHLVPSHSVLSCPITLSCLIPPCPIPFQPILSFPILSCPIPSCLFPPVPSHSVPWPPSCATLCPTVVAAPT